jgi:hypothetical protein
MRLTAIILLVANILLAGGMLVTTALKPGHTGPRTEFSADRVRMVTEDKPKSAAPVPLPADAAESESGAALCLQWSGIPAARAQEARDQLALALTGISFREKAGPGDTVMLLLDGVKSTTTKALTRLKEQFPGSTVKATLCDDTANQGP